MKRSFSPFAVTALATLSVLAIPVQAANSWRVIGWSDLGINEMERDYSLFAIYPPNGTIRAQVIDPTGLLYKGASGVTVTYEAIADPTGSINSSSSGKTNFWQFAKALFNVNLAPETGISGNKMPGSANTPQTMVFDGAYNRFSATSVPITPYDDAWNLNYYPMIKLTARDSSGNVLATTRITLPVSNEVECRGCHASGVYSAAQPLAGYANDPNPNRDFKLNILQIHDEKNRRSPSYIAALANLNYSASGLLATATGGTPVSCTACHLSNQFNDSGLATPGISGITTLTTAMHSYHAGMVDPNTNDIMDNGTNRSTCYSCHPGSHTQALRGPMGKSVDTTGTLQVQCQSCHGTMSAIADTARNGWVDLPNCQACHTGTASASGVVRLTSALTATGALNTTSDTTFATTPNQPSSGASLYRFSTGHGNLQCAACHGSTHAELPSSQPNDNLQATDFGSNVNGPLRECTVCHQSGISSPTGGPHGMHDVGSGWVSNHSRNIGRSATACAVCHGQNYTGTVLSAAFTTRTLSTGYGAIQMYRGFIVSCYTCHNGPNGNGSQGAVPVVTNTSANAITGQTVTIPVSIANGGVLRVLTQPVNGHAWVSGSSLLYQSNATFEGTETVNYAAQSPAGRDSNLGTATLKVTAATRPTFASTGVANAASYAPGVAPGMIAYIYGSAMGPATLAPYEFNSGGFIEKATAATRVLFDGIPAPLLYTSNNAVAAIVPYGIAATGTTNMAVEYNGIQSNKVGIPISTALPGIFTANASGKGDAAVINQDNTFNSPTNPATQGSVITIFATGEGATNPKGIDGKLAVAPYTVPAQSVTVTIGGQAAQVQYAGGAPGEVAGMLQINAVVPTGLTPGPVPVVVSVGGTQSATGVTVEVK